MIYMFLAEGFEEVEALCPLDIMRRAGLSVTTVGVGSKNITGAHGITVVSDILDAEYDGRELEMVFLPGGMPGTLNLAESSVVNGAINTAYESGKYIAAICAAPSILGDMGLLSGKKAVCYPGFENRLAGAILSDERVVRDGNVITAVGMGAAAEMGLLIVELLCGKKKAAELGRAILYE